MLLTSIELVIEALVQWQFLLTLFIIESVIRTLSHPKDAVEQLSAKEKTETIERANELHSRALSLIALVVAGVSIILSDSSNQETALPGLTLLALAASFLMVSHQSKNLVRGRRLWSQFQERTMEYGALSLFAGLILLYQFYSKAQTATVLLQGAFLVVLLIRLNAVQKLVRSDFRKWKKQEGISRLVWSVKAMIAAIQQKFDKIGN